MKTRCPCCGAENSLDALVAHEDARAAVWAVAQAGGETVRLAVKYLGLFRPAKSSLSFARMTTLLEELLPDLNRRAIRRDGREYPAPPEAWRYAFTEVLNRRGSLKLPLKSHGYLYEIIAGWQGQAAQNGEIAAPALSGCLPAQGAPTTPQHSATLNGAAAGERYRR